MTPELIIGVVIAALLVYAIATHKIDLAKLKGDITSHLAAVHATAQATHSAALAPVSVVSVAQPVAPSDPAALVAAVVNAPIPNAPGGPATVLGGGSTVLGGGGGGGGEPVQNRFASYAGWPMIGLISALGRRLTAEEEQQALAAGVTPLKPTDVIPFGDGSDAAANAGARRDEEENATTWDYSRPNSPRIFRTTGPGSVVRTLPIPADARCHEIVLHTSKTQGNYPDLVDLTVLEVATGRIAMAGRINVDFGNPRFAAEPGQSYVVTATTGDALAVNGSCALAMAVRFEAVP
jgi:hypothetical protein